MNNYLILLRNLRNIIPIIFILLIGIITHWQWFFYSNEIFTSGDTIWSTQKSILDNLNIPNLMSGYGLGGINLGLTVYPANLIQAFLVKIGLNQNLVFSLFFLYPVALVTPLSMYLLAEYIFSNKLVSFTASTIFTYSTPIIVGSTGIMTSSVTTAFTPLIILYFIKSLNEKSFRSLAISLLFVSIVITYDVRYLFVIYLILFLYFIFFITIQNYKNFNFRNIFFSKSTRLFYFFILITIFLNLYWILIIFTDSSEISEITARALWGKNLVSITQSLFLNHSIWNGSKLIPFYHNSLPLSSILIPLLFIAALLKFNKNNILLSFFTIISLLGIFLTKMNNFPFTDLYEWIYNNVPGFGFFRESSKFYLIIAIGYAIVISSLLHGIKKPRFKYALFILINIIFLINTIPLINGEIKTMYLKKEIPKDYVKLNTIIDNNNEFFRTLLFPRYSTWSQNNLIHPRLSYLDLKNNNDHIKNIMAIDMYDNSIITSSEFINFLNNYSIRYLILPLEDIQNDDNFFEYLGERKKWKNILENLSSLRNLKKIDAKFDQLLVYENPYFKAKFRRDDEDIYEYDCNMFNNCSFIGKFNEEDTEIIFSMNYSNNYKIYIEKNGKDITHLYRIKHYKDYYGLNRFKISKKDSVNNTQRGNVIFKVQINKELLFIHYIFSLISLLTFSFLVYIIIFKSKLKF